MTYPERPAQVAGPNLVTVGAAALHCDTIREWVDRGIKRGKIPFVRINGTRMVDLDVVGAYLESRAVKLSGVAQ